MGVDPDQRALLFSRAYKSYFAMLVMQGIETHDYGPRLA